MSHDARRWNLSPECLYIDCFTRVFLRDHVDPRTIASACNIGIGVGEFDDWLGYWLQDHARLTSVDIDGAIVHAFRERQTREGHPNPSEAIHADLLRAELGMFDLVTVVGSTVHETHAPARALRAAQRWVRPGGWLYATILHGMGDPTHLSVDITGVKHRRSFLDLPDAAFTAILARSS